MITSVRMVARPRPRRVLFLTGHLGYGGSEKQLSLLVCHLNRARWEPHILVFHPSPNADHASLLRQAGIGVTTMAQAASRLRKLTLTVRCTRAWRPQVVHSWSVHDNPYAGVAGHLAGVPLRWGSLRGSLTLPGFSGLPGLSQRVALSSVQRLVVNCAALVDELTERGVNPSRIHLLPNCVDLGAFRGERQPSLLLPELGLGHQHRVVLSVGNIRKVKNHRLLVRALAMVIPAHPEVRGLIVGETLAGEEATRAALDDEIRAAGLTGRVVLAGFRADVPELLRGSVALCLTSDSEGMPNVVLEAMAAGVPVVATRTGGVTEVVEDGSSGLLVEPGDALGLTRALTLVLEQPERAAGMARTARKKVEAEHDCAGSARMLEMLYDRALGERGWREAQSAAEPR